MSFLVTVVVLDLEDIFCFLLYDIGVSSYCKKVMVTVSLTLLALKTSLLVVLILFPSLVLVGGRLLMLATRHVSRKSVSKLSLSGIFFLFFHGLISLGVP